jgi:YD repeat-containing protein
MCWHFREGNFMNLKYSPLPKDAVMNKARFTLLQHSILFASILALSAEAQTLKYTYDALGRVTFVEDATNGNRDYDYDKAGNRLLVSINTANDDAAKPVEPSVPAAPTGLSVQGPLSPSGDGYNFSWNPVVGATSYEGKLKDGTSFTKTGTSGSSAGPRPDWVRALNSVGAGPIAYFP